MPAGSTAFSNLSPPSRPRGRGQDQLTRSVTELSPPSKSRHSHHWRHEHDPAQHQHRHRHHHRHGGHHPEKHHRHHVDGHYGWTHRRDRLDDERAPYSAGGALQNARHSLELTRSEMATPSFSPNVSRRASVLAQEDIASMLVASSAGQAAAAAVAPRSTEEELLEEKERAATRIAGLKKTLVDVNEFSTTTTRRLDDTYYAVLEKTSLLQSTIAAIKELAVTSAGITSTFEKESQDMVKDVQGQLSSLAQFEQHEKRISSLQGRIQDGRERIEALSGRVDVVRDRIEGWERADMEWRERTRKRLRSVWIVMSLITFVVVFLLVGVRYAPPATDLGNPSADVPSPTPFSLFGKEAGAGYRPRSRSVEDDVGDTPGLPLWKDRQVGREDQLRFLDEL